MSILIFIIVLGILIFVHELGHFIFAKKTGMLVEEFALGFPPRIFSFKKGETKYSLGLIPVGGFVKILGEEYEEGIEETEQSKEQLARRFANQPKRSQVLVLVAGVFFNFLLAWALISVGFMWGLPMAVDQSENGTVTDAELVLLSVLPNSPAEQAGLERGDTILSLSDASNSVSGEEGAEVVEKFISSHNEKPLTLSYRRGDEVSSVELLPQTGIVEGQPAIGVSFSLLGLVRFGFWQAWWEGLKYTASLTLATIVGLFIFIKGLFTGGADLSQISGPIGIVTMVGDAFKFGFAYLLSFVSLISINLAVINLIPFPALDGGRLLFVLIEAIKGSPLKAKVANTLNLIGFAFLILMMLLVTFSDISKFF